jgi:lysophospholipase L1-like esterase
MHRLSIAAVSALLLSRVCFAAPQFDFETDPQGWAPEGGAIASVTTSTTRAFAGSKSLAIQFAASGAAGQQYVLVNGPGVTAGAQVTLQLFIPAGAPIASLQGFVQESEATGWRYTAQWVPGSSLTPGAWNAVTLEVPSDAGQIDTLGVEVELSGAFNGKLWLDAVDWAGSSGSSGGGASFGGEGSGGGGGSAGGGGTASGDACLRIMPLGDSITLGVNGGYRNNLYTTLESQGCGVNYVGSQDDEYAECVDRDHEGHPGYSIYDISSEADGWLASASPDYILLMIGTNDIAWWTVKSASQIAADQNALIDQLQADRPGAWIIVASIPPISAKSIPPNGVNRATLAHQYNVAMKANAQSRINAGQQVRFADVEPALTLSDLYDGVHPTQAAHGKIAAVFAQVLGGLVSCGGGAAPVCSP